MKVEIKIRKDGERGLFSTEDIKKGELICILPIDYVQLDNNWYTTTSQPNKINFRYGIMCEIDKNCDTEYQSVIELMSWKYKKCGGCFTLSKKANVVGVSNPDTTGGHYIGHMINDYVDMTFLSENSYEKMSTEFSNVKVLPKLGMIEDRLGLKVLATKDIKKGYELYLSYGPEYWKKYSRKESAVYTVNLSLVSVK